jgi:ElaB/YqjD/DUF883 family membrane-anchored ribosome-binding protein
MSRDPSPLKTMATQSREAMAMAEAMAHDRAGDLAGRRGKVGAAADWAIGKAKDGLRSAAGQARERATTAVATYTRQDPMRAVLIAAAVGALLMGFVATLARSGARTVQRTVRR